MYFWAVLSIMLSVGGNYNEFCSNIYVVKIWGEFFGEFVMRIFPNKKSRESTFGIFLLQIIQEEQKFFWNPKFEVVQSFVWVNSKLLVSTYPLLDTVSLTSDTPINVRYAANHLVM